jgi:DNA ligase (NAD+)
MCKKIQNNSVFFYSIIKIEILLIQYKYYQLIIFIMFQETKIIILSNNQKNSLIILLDNLQRIMLKNGDKFRASAYQKACTSFQLHINDISTVASIEKIPNIGASIYKKIVEYLQNGTLSILENDVNDPTNIFVKIYGVGPKKAKELVNDGINNLDDLKLCSKDVLNDIQQIGLKYYDDILKRIPREEINIYNELFVMAKNTLNNTNNFKYEIVGSYRRGHDTSGDIDVIITSSLEEFNEFLDKLIEKKIIIEVLSRGNTKSLVITKLNTQSIARRVDFLHTNETQYPFAILYFTGSKLFNTGMRQQALNMGYTLNEHGMSHIINNKKGDPVTQTIKTEKDIFDFLNMEYKTPNERLDNNSIVLKNNLIVTPMSKKTTLKKRNKKIIKLSLKTPKIIVENLRQKGVSFLYTLSENELNNTIIEAKHTYYNNMVPIMTDNEYDIFVEFMNEQFPNNIETKKIGAPIEMDRVKVKMPYFMPSMDKIKPDTGELEKWMKKYQGEYLISEKLDGVSGLYTTCGGQPQLYKHGDGKEGLDLSNLIKYFNLPPVTNACLRGEFVISKSIFLEKYSDKFANARNLVAGILNRKHMDDRINDVDFVIYEVIEPSLKPFEQVKLLERFNTKYNTKIFSSFNISDTKLLTNTFLSNKLIDWRQKNIYDIDGLIVTHNEIYERTNKNPKHSFAFKMILNDSIFETIVKDVLWKPSKDGYLKPRVQIEPVFIDGVKIEYATGNNAAFIISNKIGVGALVEIIRSGDVIPKIQRVVVPATTFKGPSSEYKYDWNETCIDFILTNKHENIDVIEKNIGMFFNTLKIDGLNKGTISSLVSAGYDSIKKILKLNINDYLKLDGFQIKKATKIYTNICNKIESADLCTIMVASNMLGRGIGKETISSILKEYSNVLIDNLPIENKKEKLLQINGISLKTANLFLSNITLFLQFLEDLELTYKLEEYNNSINNNKNNNENNHILADKTIVITGKRDNDLIDKIKKFGTKITTSVSKNTFVLIVDTYELKNNKTEKADELNIDIMTNNEFKQKYNL